MLRSWKNFWQLICYSGKNLFSLGRINFCKKLICSNPEKISVGIFVSVLEKIYFCLIWKILIYQPKMRQKLVIFEQYFGSIFKYFGQRRCSAARWNPTLTYTFIPQDPALAIFTKVVINSSNNNEKQHQINFSWAHLNYINMAILLI